MGPGSEKDQEGVYLVCLTGHKGTWGSQSSSKMGRIRLQIASVSPLIHLYLIVIYDIIMVERPYPTCVKVRKVRMVHAIMSNIVILCVLS